MLELSVFCITGGANDACNDSLGANRFRTITSITREEPKSDN
jgi:hypothetical protein